MNLNGEQKSLLHPDINVNGNIFIPSQTDALIKEVLNLRSIITGLELEISQFRETIKELVRALEHQIKIADNAYGLLNRDQKYMFDEQMEKK